MSSFRAFPDFTVTDGAPQPWQRRSVKAPILGVGGGAGRPGKRESGLVYPRFPSAAAFQSSQARVSTPALVAIDAAASPSLR